MTSRRRQIRRVAVPISDTDCLSRGKLTIYSCFESMDSFKQALGRFRMVQQNDVSSAVKRVRCTYHMVTF